MRCILVCEDDLTIQRLVRATLRTEPYALVFASDGLEGLSRATELHPDLIVTDLMMPGLDGFELRRKLRADASLAAIPVVLLTASAQRQDLDAAAEAGFDRVVTKPFSPAEFRQELRALLGDAG